MEPTQPIEWYQQGNWPLVGAILLLIISNAIALWKIVYQARQSLKEQLRLKSIEFVSEQLSKFYNPLYSLLIANKEIFNKCGPHTFPDDHYKRIEAASNWNRLKEKVILPNNRKIVEILREHSHLIHETDDIISYTNLNNHLYLYEVFNEEPTELYSDFKFPTEIVDHVFKQREKVSIKYKTLKES